MTSPIEELIQFVAKETGWTKQETQTFLGAIRAADPDELLEHIPIIVDIAVKAEHMAELIALIKQGVVLVRLDNGELSVSLPPNTQVEKVESGLRVTIEPERAA